MNILIFAIVSALICAILISAAALFYLRRYNGISESNRRALEFIRIRMWDDAVRVLQGALIRDPDHALTNYNMGFVLYFGKQAADLARVHFIKAIQTNPKMASAHYALGHLYFHKYNDVEKARDELLTAVKINPGLSEAYNTLGFISIAKSVWAAAAKEFRKAVEVNPECDEAWCNLSIANINLGHTAEAIDAGKRYVALQPSSAQAHSNLGNIYGMCGKRNEALEEFSAALSIDPSNWLYHFWTGCVQLQNKYFEQAVVSFHEALRIHGEFALAYYNLALGYEALDQKEAARTHIEKAIELDPSLGKGLI